MELELAQALVAALAESGEEARIYEGYSGRGMYGQKTTGVVTQSTTTLLTAALCSPHCFQDEGGSPLFDDVGTFNDDSLGHDTIVY